MKTIGLDDVVSYVMVGFKETVPLAEAKSIVHNLKYSVRDEDLYDSVQILDVACPPNTTFGTAKADFEIGKYATKVRYVDPPKTAEHKD